MAITTEQVVIEFTTQTAQLDAAIDLFEKTGQIDKQASTQFKQTNAELQKRSKIINDVAKNTDQATDKMVVSIEEVQQIVEHMLKDVIEGAMLGVKDALEEAGLEFDEFGKVVNKNNNDVEKSTNTVRARLGEVVKQLQLLKVQGKDNTEQYKALVVEAGNLRDALGDVNAEVNNAAANSQNLDGLIQAATGITAGFAVAEGTVGLFGGAQEELNETLVKVTSVMATLQGLQEINNVLQKENAAITFLQTAYQKIYNIVIGESIGLMAAFRVAMAATGIGIFIAAIVILINTLKKQDQELENVNAELERNKKNIEADTQAILLLAEQEEARAQAANKQESEITRIRGRSLQAQRKAIDEANADLIKQRDVLDATSEAYFKLNAQVEANNSLIEEIDNKIILEKINLDKQLRQERLQGIANEIDAQLAGAIKNSKQELSLAKQSAQAKAAIELDAAGDNLQARLLIEANLQKQLRDLDRTFAQVRQQDAIAATESQLTKVQLAREDINDRATQQEIDLQKKAIEQRARLELLQEGLTTNQRLQIIRNANAERVRIQREFDKQTTINVIQDEISRNNALLANTKLTEQERFDIQADNLVAQAQIEIEQNKGLTDKIKEIRKQLEVDLRALRLQFLQKQLNDELSLQASRTGALRRANERLANDENKSLSKRLTAINQLAALDIANINKRQDSLAQQLREGLISQEDYNVQYAELKDEELRITEETEFKKRALAKQTQKENILLGLDTANQLLSIVQQFGQQQTEAEQMRIEAQRKEIDDLKEAGAITEKEALARQKKLDQEERNIKRKQAERDKAIALFQAVINTAAAVVKALPNLVLAGIAAALGAAQIALIASKPIPKFGKGKKGNYEGPGEIGETGFELMERAGQMYLATKPTLVWVGKRDKIFNPTETAAMLEKNNLRAGDKIKTLAGSNNYYNAGANIDYAKLGKTISDNMPQAGLNVDQEGFTTWVQGKNAFNKYLNNRRSY